MRIPFFQKPVHEDEQDPENYEYWKDPRLDDEGTYDYLIEDLPHDSGNWEFNYLCKCESCGKKTTISFNTHHYFYCWDGWDSMDYTECWRCVLRHKINRKMHKIKKQTRALYFALKWCCEHKTFKDFHTMYEIALD